MSSIGATYNLHLWRVAFVSLPLNFIEVNNGENAFSLRNSDVNMTENWTIYLCFICRESELRPSRSLPESSSRSTTRSWPMTSTPTRRSPVRSPSFLPREWETRLQASSPTWWRESSRSLFVEFRWSFKRRRERPDLTSSLRYECYSPWVLVRCLTLFMFAFASLCFIVEIRFGAGGDQDRSWDQGYVGRHELQGFVIHEAWRVNIRLNSPLMYKVYDFSELCELIRFSFRAFCFILSTPVWVSLCPVWLLSL